MTAAVSSLVCNAMSTLTFGLSTPSAAEPGAFYGSDRPPSRPTVSAEWIEVLVDFPFRGTGDAPGEENKLFTYRLPAQLTVQPGDILSVPFGSQQVGAIAIRFVSQLPLNLDPAKVKDVEDVVSTGFFAPTYWELLERTATYYCTPLIQVIRASLPPGLLSRSVRRIRLNKNAIAPNAELFLNPAASQILQLLQAQKNGDYTWQYLQRQVKGANRGLRDLLNRGWVESYLEPPHPPQPKLKPAVTLIVNAFVTNLTQRQQEVLEVLRRGGGEMWVNDLLKICSASSSVLKALEQKGSVVIDQREVLRRDRPIPQIADSPKTLTAFQAEALAFINSFSGFRQVLLHGVTGSGKTEVYLQAIAPILASGKSALVLVPEIGLTPQLTDRFRARFGEQICVYHSALSDGERYDTWRQMLAGEPQIVIGTRSAIFAPLPQLGLIILDEEHDTSFKQEQPAPCYHARTVAKWRAELENCPLILGSATPALETIFATQINNSSSLPTIHYLSLPERIYSRPMPPIQIVDMRQELRQGNRSIFSVALQNALEELQARQQQGILFIHRRGHSTFVSCRSCGYVMECPNCDVSLSYHQIGEGTSEMLRCHYCNHTERHPQNCPECRSPYFKNFGSGTQRVEQELTRLFPQLRAIRFDSDTTRNKGDHRRLLTQFARGEADILLGTQMLTKGLDLAGVTLVGVVSADGLLNLSDYRASERAFQTLTQVAGRAGRGDDPGRVIMQTYTPEHRVIQAVRRHEYASFIETELAARAALNYPPSGRLVLLRLSSLEAAEVAVTAVQLASVCQEYIEGLSLPGCELLGPAPAAIMRVANRYRWQILLKLPLDESVDLSDLSRLRDRIPRSVSLTIDVDPLNFG